MRKFTWLFLTFWAALTASAQSIQTDPLPSAVSCAGASLSVTFSATGTFNAGNEFRAQLSDASGSFAAPTAIGSLSGTAPGTITATIPAGAATGSGYRVRVVSTDPAVNGDDNGMDITINAAPQVSVSASSASTCPATQLTLTASGASSYTWSVSALPADIGTPLLAVGTRRLRTGYNGPILRLRRDFDGVESDFGLSGNVLDTAAVGAWLGGSSATVSRLYDQSGNGRHMVQVNSNLQPAFELSGTNGRPTVRFAYGRYLRNTYTFSNPLTVVYAGRLTGGSNNRVLSSVSNNWLLGWWSGNQASAFFEGWIDVGRAQTGTDVHVYTGLQSEGQGRIFEDAYLSASNTPSAPPAGLQMNGSGVYFTESSDCAIFDLVVYGGVLSDAERNRAESSIWQYWVSDAQLFFTTPSSGSASVTVTGSTPGCASSSATFTRTVSAPGNPVLFGDDKWLVTVFKGGSDQLNDANWQTNYSGYFESASLDFRSYDFWCISCTPSSAPGYQGCPVPADNHSWSARRRGFPCAIYRLDVNGQGGGAQLWINGAKVWERDENGSSAIGAWYGSLGPNDSVEFRGSDGAGSSDANLIIQPLPPLTLTYSAASACAGNTPLTPTLTGPGGGRYTAPAGLAIDSLTGVVNPAQSQPGSYLVTYSWETASCTGTQTISATTTVEMRTVQGDPAVFGNDQWNVYAWNNGPTGAAWSSNYAGYYTTANLGFNSTADWNSGSRPSEAANYQGCPVAYDYHSFSAKRQGFPCGFYRLDVPGHDDDAQLFVNGVKVWEHGGCCDAHTDVWRGYLGPNDRVEFRIRELGGGSFGALSLVSVSPSSITYGSARFCGAAGAVSPVRTGPAGGTYSAAPAGLALDTLTGIITPSGSVPGTYTVTYTPPAFAGCPVLPDTASLSINPVLAVAPLPDTTTCNGTTMAGIVLTGTPGATFSWSNSDTSIGLAANGVSLIPYFIARNTGQAPVTANIRTYAWDLSRASVVTGKIDPTSASSSKRPYYDYYTGACGYPKSLAGEYPGSEYYNRHRFRNDANFPVCVTVNIDNLGGGDVYVAAYRDSFNAGNLAQNYLSDMGYPVYSYYPQYYGPQLFSFELPAHSDLILVAWAPDNGYCESYRLTVAGLPTVCGNPERSFTITVNPTPAASFSYTGSPFCANGSTGLPTITGSAGGRFSSTAGLSLDSLTGAIQPAQSAPGTYTVTHIVPGTGDCTADTATATVEILAAATPVNPVTSQVVCAGAMTFPVGFTGSGSSFTWTNNNPSVGLAASGSGAIAAFRAQNSGTTPAVAEITVSGGSGACAVSTQTFTITVLPTPQVNAVGNPVLCGNVPSGAIGFAGVATAYHWTNSNPAIGLAASGSGPISFQAVNNGATPASGTIAVTPLYQMGATTCSSKPQTFTITVRPAVSMNPVSSQTLCSGSSTSVAFSGAPAGAVYSWTNDNTSIGLAAAGTGSITAIVVSNPTPITQVATITVVPRLSQCAGPAQTFTLAVNPGAGSISYPGSPYCTTGEARVLRSGNSVGTFTAVPAGLPIHAATGAINLAYSQPGTYTVTFTVSGSTCAPSTSTQVTVLPRATVSSVSNRVHCAGITTLPIMFTGTATSYTWTNSNPAIGLAASGTGNLPAFVATNNTNAPVFGLITVVPAGNGTSGCGGRAMVFRILVNPTPSAHTVAAQVYCRAIPTNALTFTGPVGNTRFNWTASNQAVGLPASRGSNSIPSFTTTSGNAAPVSSIITVTPVANKCAGAPIQFPYVVNPCNARMAPVTRTGEGLLPDDVQIGPNPARQQVSVWLNGKRTGPHSIEVLDVYGRSLLRPATFTGSRYTIDLQGLVAGNYILRIVDIATQEAVQQPLIKL
ncbi:hypothetical protein [Flaviaesturariibacter amylovorans]|uniref:T9SS type A sorting domain-containing protein n=1 Tax=Flaviaesturariibacter amylovorans TaxID=1084520 RepID=A0ABP8H0P8_9BACT